MLIERETIEYAGPITEAVEFVFDRRVNVLIGPNSSGKSTILRHLDSRGYEDRDYHDPPGSLGDDDVRFTREWMTVISVPSSRLPFPPTPDVAHEYAQINSLVEEYNVLDSRVIFRRLQNFVHETRSLSESYGIRYSDDFSEEIERARQDIVKLAVNCAAEICAEVLQNKTPDQYSYEPEDPRALQGISRLTYEFWRVFTTDPLPYSITLGDLSSGTQGPLTWLLHVAMELHASFVRLADGDLHSKVELVGQTPEGCDLWGVRDSSSSTESGWTDMPFVLLIDEIENHLHPSWQRRVVNALRNHFPNVQIFATTHSPFVVAGLRAGQVHILNRNEDGVVTASKNEEDIVGWSVDEVLRAFMGVDDPTDDPTAVAAAELRQLRDEEPRAGEREEEERQARIQELRRLVDRDLLAGGHKARRREEFAQRFREAMARRQREEEISQDGA